MHSKGKNKMALDNRAGKTSFMFHNTTPDRRSVDTESYETVSSVSTPRFGDSDGGNKLNRKVIEDVYDGNMNDEKLSMLIEDTDENEDSVHK